MKILPIGVFSPFFKAIFCEISLFWVKTLRHLPHSANIFRGAPPISLKKQVKTSKNVPKSPKCCSLPQPAAACRSLMQPLQPLQPAAACRSLPQPAIVRLLTPPTIRGVIISQRIFGFLGVIYDGVSRGKRAAPCINGPHTDRPKHGAPH